MLSIPVVVITNDNHLWCLPPFSYCFNQFWKYQDVEVWGFNPPKTTMPDNFSFNSIGNTNLPVNKWTNGVAKVLRNLSASHFVLLLEDFWIMERVNVQLVQSMADYIGLPGNEQILRIDLSADRASRKQSKTYDRHQGYEIIFTPHFTPYQMSYQAAIWSRDMMLDVLRMNETPWESEVEGTKRLKKRPDIKVLGTKLYPVKYIPAFRARKNVVQNMHKMPQPHRDRVMGMVPRGKR